MESCLPIIYKFTSKGQVQQWQIFWENGEFWTEEGIKGGKLTKSTPTKCEPKNVGRANATTAAEQAEKEARAKHQKKLDKGYAEVLGEGRTYFKPMLAEDYKDKETGEKYPYIDKLVWQSPVRKFVQPKLDGIRSINEEGTLASREGNPFVTCPHLLQKMCSLDGELYNHKFKKDFNAIVSLIKREKPTEEDIAMAKKYAQMWVYDLPSHKGNFGERNKALKEVVKKLDNPAIVYVPTYEITTEAELQAYHKEFKKQGFEGTILRLDKPYENKRTTSLLKYKDFIDEEFEILGYEEGKGGRTGTIGKFILKNNKKEGDDTFKSNVKGSFSYLRNVWVNRECYVGKLATVQYFNRTPLKGEKGNVPRFGYVIKLDRQSYE
jgi:hypothetical protein